jgi:hypothetical protein
MAKVFMEWSDNNYRLLWEEESKWCLSQHLPRMVKSVSLQTEIMLDTWNILTMVSGGTVTNVASLQTKSVGSRALTVLID